MMVAESSGRSERGAKGPTIANCSEFQRISANFGDIWLGLRGDTPHLEADWLLSLVFCDSLGCTLVRTRTHTHRQADTQIQACTPTGPGNGFLLAGEGEGDGDGRMFDIWCVVESAHFNLFVDCSNRSAQEQRGTEMFGGVALLTLTEAVTVRRRRFPCRNSQHL